MKFYEIMMFTEGDTNVVVYESDKNIFSDNVTLLIEGTNRDLFENNTVEKYRDHSVLGIEVKDNKLIVIVWDNPFKEE